MYNELRYREFVTHNIFRSCGMNSTSFISKDDSNVPVAEGYDATYNENNKLEWRKNIYSFPPIGTSDGGAFTTVGDLDLFMRALANGELLSTELTQEIMKPQSTIAREFEWGKIINGYGFHFTYDLSGKLIRMYKDGSNAGVAAMFAYYPEIDTTSTILGNQTCNIWELHWKAESLILTDR